MKTIQLLPGVFLLFVGFTICTNYTCDYSFGEQSWNYSKLFYEQEHTLPTGTVDFNVTLPHENGKMISFVCVNVTGADLNTTKVAFASFFYRVTVNFEKATENVVVKILALNHGY